MGHQYLKIDPQITGYVRTILIIDNAPGAASQDLPLFTKGMPALLCRIEGDKSPITLYGQSVPDEKWIIENDVLLIVYFFKPFAIGPIFKVPAKELKGNPVPLDLWNAQKVVALNLQLFHARSVKEKIEVLNHFIYSQLQLNRRECDIVQFATDSLMQDSDAQALTQILKELNLTERTFQRIFKKYVGITPNEYRRICQFYFAFSQLKGGHFDKQTDVAFDNGYFDQSHYIRSFKEFTNTTPNDYLRSGLPKKKE
jgi:AraC-like DNA-binding protein